MKVKGIQRISGVITVLIILIFSSLASSQGNLSQTVRGYVLDAHTKTPLPGATVIVEGIEPLLGTTTDLNGNFRFDDIPVGRHNFRVSYVGYEPFRMSEVMYNPQFKTCNFSIQNVHILIFRLLFIAVALLLYYNQQNQNRFLEKPNG